MVRILAFMLAMLLGVGAQAVCYPDAKSAYAALQQIKYPPVNINTANAAQLVTLHGVGQKLAARIIEERTRGAFSSADDLIRVKGVGRVLIEKNRARLVVQ